jgi:hypothetical protein
MEGHSWLDGPERVQPDAVPGPVEQADTELLLELPDRRLAEPQRACRRCHVLGLGLGPGVASGWAASEGHQRGAASQTSAFYLLAYYLGSSVFGVLGTSLWESGRWTAVAIMAGLLLLIAAIAGGTQTRLGRRVGPHRCKVPQPPDLPALDL